MVRGLLILFLGPVNSSLKSAAASILDASGALAALRFFRSRASGTVLTFHRVLPLKDVSLAYDRHMVTSAEIFEQLVRLLKQDCRVVELEELLHRPKGRFQKELVSLTFDDGWEDTYSVAFPILRSLGLPATVFVCSELTDTAEDFVTLPEERFARVWQAYQGAGNLQELITDLRAWGVPTAPQVTRRAISRRVRNLPMRTRLLLLSHLESCSPSAVEAGRSLMTWEEARVMSRNGFTVGSHTARHCTLTAEDDRSVVRELSESRDRIAAELGRPPEFFAYPNGAYSSHIMESVRGAGFSHAFTTDLGLVNQQTCAWAVPRLAIEDAAINDKRGRVSTSRVKLHLQAFKGRRPPRADSKDCLADAPV